MRIESVTAVAFGPFVKETLDLALGLTVVHGDNESGKSSWHAATYAALCGRRRGRGGLRTEDRDFRDQHRPWGGDCWQVRCVVALDDGRLVELWHDLDGLVDCGAKELTLGDDLANEIMYDGAPDGSMWLGLNRQTIAATAVVNQADLNGVVTSAELLQEDLQRAAATAGKDQTAATALTALRDYRSSHVGRDIRNSVRPLRMAIKAQELAEAELAEARAAHANYLEQLADAEQAREHAADATGLCKTAEQQRDAAAHLVEAAREARLAEERVAHLQERAEELSTAAHDLQQRFGRARDLTAELGDEEPPGSPADEELARRVTGAVAAWRAAPDAANLEGPSAEQLEAELAALPEPPVGDQRADAELRRLRDALDETTAVLESTQRRQPAEPDVSAPQLAAALRAGPEVVRWLAERLSEQGVREDPHLADATSTAVTDLAVARGALRAAEAAETAALDSLRRCAAGSIPARRGTPGLSATVALTVGAVLCGMGLLLMFLLGQPVPGAVALLLGLTGVAAGLDTRRTPVSHAGAAGSTATAERGLGDARQRLRRARDGLSACEFASAQAQARADAAAQDTRRAAARWQAAAADANERGLPADADALQQLAAQAADARTAQDTFARWAREHESDRRAQQAAQQRLADALTSRGCDCSAGVLDAYSAYERDCAANAEQAQVVSRRPDLLRRLGERRDAERRHAGALATRLRAGSDLAAAAGALSMDTPPRLDDATAGSLAARLDQWLSERSALLAVLDEERGRWHDLQALLRGTSLPELAVAAEGKALAASDTQTAAQRAARSLQDKHAERAAAARAVGTVSTVDEPSARRLLDERDAVLSAATDVEREAEKRAAELGGQVAAAAEALSVAEAEEAVEQAVRELRRLRDLDDVLSLTTSYLERAQNDVFSRMAPVLAGTLTSWLPRLTGGRYVEAIVHPKTLRVQVREASGQWREANLLSVGTAEQVYLLLRVALAEHLATTSAVCPLLLDDVTVQADPTRTVAILEMCKALADEGRQVVLFAQEPAVADWAERHLDGDKHRVIHLDPVPVG